MGLGTITQGSGGKRVGYREKTRVFGNTNTYGNKR